MSDTVSVRVYVPTAVDDDVTETVKENMADMFRGYTTYGRKGGWVDNAGNLIQEDVRVIESITDGNEPARRVKSMANFVARNSDEKSVMWDIRPICIHGFES